MAREIELPSGSTLKLNLAPFSEAKALWNAVLAEMKDLKITDAEADVMDFIKGLFCVGFSSERVEKALSKCMQRCTIGGRKIEESIFEAEEHRGDYVVACLEVAQENIGPFLKSLFARFNQLSSLPEKLGLESK